MKYSVFYTVKYILDKRIIEAHLYIFEKKRFFNLRKKEKRKFTNQKQTK